MISDLAYVGKCVLIGTAYIIENRNVILSTYSIYDLTKFTFNVSDKLGIIEIIRKKINKSDTPIIMMIIDGKEHSDVGEFEMIEYL